MKPRTTAKLLKGKLLFNIRGGGARLLGPGDTLLAWIREDATAPGLHGDTVEARRTTGDQAQVTRVLERARTTVVGLFQKKKDHTWLVPDDVRMPWNVTLRPGGKLPRTPRAGDKVVARLDEWKDATQNPTAQVIEILGAAHAPGIDLLAIARSYSISEEFPPDVLREADAIPARIPEHEIARREDCRGDFVLTIDPDDAKDHDDAITVSRLRDGWRLAVHIADVAHYVRPGTALDREARKRGNSTYLPGQCLPMLPLRLSADICSLRAGVDRLAHTAFLEYTAQGHLRRVRFARTIICVHTRLTYGQAGQMLRGETVPGFASEVPERVREAWSLASLLRKHRFDAGSLDLDFPEIKIHLDAQGRADRIERTLHDESHQLVEECMLAANEAVAHAIKNRTTPCIYRIHEKPDPARLEEFRQTLLTVGIRTGDLTQRREVIKMLAALRGRCDEPRLKVEFLKSLRRACYSPDPLGHYGLSKVDYLHFTSPIRRYADLIAHRVLAGERTGGRKELTDIATHLSNTERNSASAEMDAVQLKKMEYFQRQIEARKPEEYDATITDIRHSGLIIDIPAVDATGLIPAEQVPGGPWDFDATRKRIHNRRTKRQYQPGDALRVFLTRVDAEKRQLDFALIPRR